MIFIYYLINMALQKKDKNKDEKPKFNLWISFLFIFLGLGGIILGSNLVVDNATLIAQKLGVSQRIIALTIIAFGTSLPELVTTIVSSVKGEQELLLGNIIGSNIFNICVVLGIPVVIFGTVTPSSFNSIDLIALLLSAFLLFLFSESKKTIARFEGFLLLGLFAIYYFLVIVL